MTDLGRILTVLVTGDVRFILIGGAAAIAHGASRLTLDVDVVYDRAQDNLERLVAALAPFEPYLRGAPPGLPFRLDVETLERGLNFTLTTTLGPLDLLGEVTGGGAYQDLLPDTQEIEAFGVSCRCLELPRLPQLSGPRAAQKGCEHARQSNGECWHWRVDLADWLSFRGIPGPTSVTRARL